MWAVSAVACGLLPIAYRALFRICFGTVSALFRRIFCVFTNVYAGCFGVSAEAPVFLKTLPVKLISHHSGRKDGTGQIGFRIPSSTKHYAIICLVGFWTETRKRSLLAHSNSQFAVKEPPNHTLVA